MFIIAPDNGTSEEDQNRIVIALLDQSRDTNNEVLRNAFINLADVCD